MLNKVSKHFSVNVEIRFMSYLKKNKLQPLSSNNFGRLTPQLSEHKLLSPKCGWGFGSGAGHYFIIVQETVFVVRM